MKRVNGELAVSRAFGDSRLKRESLVIAEPEIQFRKINPSQDKFLVLACDGLYDVMSNSEVVSFVSKARTAEKDNITKVADVLVNYAVVTKDSTDNVSVCIIEFSKNTGQ